MIPQDQLRAIFSIFSAIPLCFLLRKLKGNTKKYYSLIITTFLQCYIFGHEVWIVYASHVLTYLTVVFKGRNCGFLVTVLSLLGLSAYNIIQMFVDYANWQMDVTSLMMGNVCKYSLFAFAYQDGGKADEQLKTAQQRNQKMVQLASFMDFICYCQFLPVSVLSFPISYHKYHTYINQKEQFANIPFAPTLRKMGLQFSLFLVTAVLHILGGIYLPPSIMSQPSFADNNFFYLIFYTFASSYLLGFKYMVGFQMGMLPIHASGISYSPELEDKFGGVKLVDLHAFWTSTSVPVRVNSWNSSCQQWLRKCVYERLKTSKQKGRLITFVVSAIWHGFYGGYYITFLTFFLLAHFSTLTFKLSKFSDNIMVKYYHKSQPYGRWILLIFLTFYFGQTGVTFIVLSLPQCFRILKGIYFAPQLLLLLGIGVTQVLLVNESRRRQKQKKT